jgi:hypothetical protein
VVGDGNTGGAPKPGIAAFITSGDQGGTSMTGRRCGTCKHFEHAPIWRKGWCRNPLLYSPQQSHLVSEQELDCERGMGNYWEPSLDYQDMTARSGFQEPVAEAFSSMGRPDVSTSPLRSSRGMPVFPVSGSSGYSDPPPPGGPDRGPLWSGDDRGDLGYYQEERYWTDYLRIAAPLLGVAILVIIFWFWMASFFGDDNDDNGEAANATTTAESMPTFSTTTTPSATGAVGTEAPGTIVVPGGDGTAGPDETAGAGDETPPPDGGETSGGALYIGALAQVANTGGTGVNVRADATTSSEILDVYLDGTEVQITDGPIEAEDFIWWQVTRDGVVGYIVEDYLALIE